MRFTLIKNLNNDSFMKPILSAFLIFMLLYIISDIVVKQFSFGIFRDAIMTTLFGNEEEFIDPISKASFLEFWHIEIFFMMMILLTLSTIFIRLGDRYRAVVLNTLMLSAIASLISLALTYFVDDSFLYIYIASFFIWHISAIYMILYSLWRLYAKTL